MKTQSPSGIPDIEHAEVGQWVLLRFPGVPSSVTSNISLEMFRVLGLLVGYEFGLCEFNIPSQWMGRLNRREMQAYLAELQQKYPEMVVTIEDKGKGQILRGY